jgi:hypothetical protein
MTQRLSVAVASMLLTKARRYRSLTHSALGLGEHGLPRSRLAVVRFDDPHDAGVEFLHIGDV